MALLKLKDFDPNYRETFNNNSIIGFKVYSDATNEKIGIVKDLLIDETECRFRYLIVDIGFWILGKEVLLPIGLSRVSLTNERVYTRGLSKEQAKTLPEFDEALQLDCSYEERVRNIYRTPATEPLVFPAPPVAPMGPIAISSFAPLVRPSTTATPNVISRQDSYPADNRQTYNYQDEPFLYEINDIDHPFLKLYEERLRVNKKRTRGGEL